MNAFKISPGIQTGLKAVGVTPETLLRKCGLPVTLFSSGQSMVTTEQLFALWRALGECSRDPAIGLKLASQIPLEQHHPVSIAAHYARTFRDGLQRMARYKILCCSEEMRLVEDKNEGSVEFDWLLSRELLHPF